MSNPFNHRNMDETVIEVINAEDEKKELTGAAIATDDFVSDLLSDLEDDVGTVYVYNQPGGPKTSLVPLFELSSDLADSTQIINRVKSEYLSSFDNFGRMTIRVHLKVNGKLRANKGINLQLSASELEQRNKFPVPEGGQNGGSDTGMLFAMFNQMQAEQRQFNQQMLQSFNQPKQGFLSNLSPEAQTTLLTVGGGIIAAYLGREKPNPMSEIKEMLALTSGLKELMPEQEKEEKWSEVIASGLEAITSMVNNQNGGAIQQTPTQQAQQPDQTKQICDYILSELENGKAGDALAAEVFDQLEQNPVAIGRIKNLLENASSAYDIMKIYHPEKADHYHKEIDLFDRCMCEVLGIELDTEIQNGDTPQE